MLPDIAAEVLLFLSRRDLDKACAVSKWLDALIAQCCDVYPLRPAYRVELLQNDCATDVWFTDERRTSFSSMDEAVYFAGLILRHSYVNEFRVGDFNSRSALLMLSPSRWTTLVDAIRNGAVERLHFYSADFCSLDDDSFLAVIGCPGLQSLVVQRSCFRSDFAMDTLIRSSATQGLLVLCVFEHNSAAPPVFSEDPVLDFLLPAGAASGRQGFNVTLEGSSGITDMFLARFFERFQSSTVRRYGSLEFRGRTPKQRGLSAYAQYLAPRSENWADATYRFPSANDNKSYEVQLTETPTCLYIECRAFQ